MLDELCKDKEMLNRYRVYLSLCLHSRIQLHGVVGWLYALSVHTINIIIPTKKRAIIIARIGEYSKVKYKGINKAHSNQTTIGWKLIIEIQSIIG